MKKVFIVALMAISTSPLFAQTKIGIKAGVNFASVLAKEDGSSSTISPSSRLSYNVGTYLDIPVGKSFSFQPGISLAGKGFKNKENYDEPEYNYSETYEVKTDLMYLEVPLNAVKKFEAGTGKFFLGAGPYLGYGIAGKQDESGSITENGKTTSYSYTDKKVFKKGSSDFENENKMKPFDFGLNFLAGYELSGGLSLNAGYGLGLTNTYRGQTATIKNKVFSISIGYSF